VWSDGLTPTNIEEGEGDNNAGHESGGRRKKHPRSAVGKAVDRQKKVVREMEKLVTQAERGSVLFVRLGVIRGPTPACSNLRILPILCGNPYKVTEPCLPSRLGPVQHLTTG